jgi:hypothetical protein
MPRTTLPDSEPAPAADAAQSTEPADKSRNDYYASLLSRAVSPEAHALIADLYARVEAWERKDAKGTKAPKRGSYKRGEKRALPFRETLERFLGDLLRAQHDKHETDKASGVVFRPMGKKDFTPDDPISYRNFVAAVAGLKGSGLITHTLGKGRFINYFGKDQRPGKASRFEAKPKLLQLAEDAGVMVAAIDERFHPELPRRTLELRSSSTRLYGKKFEGERMEFTPTPHTERLAADVKETNEFLAKFKLGDGGVHYGFVRRFNEGDVEDFKWNKGGRLYSITASSYQQLPPTERALMTINGEPVVEIDVAASYLTAFHARLKAPIDLTSDPYERVGLPRDIVKLWATVSFGSGKPLDKWSKRVTKDYLKDHNIKPRDVCSATRVRDAMLATYPVLRRLGEPGVRWADLMFFESQAIITAMRHLMLAYEMPSYPVHDSLIVPVSGAGLAATMLAHHYEFHVGVFPRLDTKSTLPGAREAVLRAVKTARRPVRGRTTAAALDL